MVREQHYRPAFETLWSSPEERRGFSMLVRPFATFAAADGERGVAAPLVAVLEQGTDLAGLLVDQGLAVRSVAVPQELGQLLAAGEIKAVVVDPELADAWSTDVPERVAEQVARRVPIVVVCRSRADATVIEARQAARGSVVLVRDQLVAADLAAVIKAEIAGSRARPVG